MQYDSQWQEIFIMMKQKISRTKRTVSNYKNEDRIKKTKKEFHQTQEFKKVVGTGTYSWTS